jgi:hypothetical protein
LESWDVTRRSTGTYLTSSRVHGAKEPSWDVGLRGGGCDRRKFQLTRGLWSSSSCRLWREDSVLIGSAMVFCNHEPPSSSMRLDWAICLLTKIQAQADSHNLLVEASSEQEQAQRGADLVKRADGG